MTVEVAVQHNTSSGIEWFGRVPAHWEIQQIKHLSPVRRGASPRPIDDPKYFDVNGAWSWVRIADVSASSGRLYSTPQKLSPLGSSLSVKLEPGSLFVSIAGTVGKPCITEIKACIHDGFVYFPNLQYSTDLLYRIFEAGNCYAGLGKMGTQLNLNTDTIGSIRIPVPPAEEQLQIVQYLEAHTAKIDTLIGKQERLIETLAERRQAVISHAVTKGLDPNVPMKDSGIYWLGDVPVTWSVRKFSHVTRLNGGQVDPRIDPYREMTLIAPNHIEQGTGRLLFTESSDEQGADSGKYLIRKGQVIYSKIRPALRKAVIAREDCLSSADMYGIDADPKCLSNDFLLVLMLSRSFTQFVIDVSMRVAMPKVNRETLAGGALWFPSLADQSKVLAHIDRETAQIDALSAKAREMIDVLKERRQALISAAVTGKIDVRGLA